MAKIRVGHNMFDNDIATVVADLACITGEDSTVFWPIDSNNNATEYPAIVVDEGAALSLGLDGYTGEADLRILIATANLPGDPDEWPKAPQRLKWSIDGKLYQIQRPRRALGGGMLLLECTLANRDRQ